MSRSCLLDLLEPRYLMARLVGVDVSTYQPNVNWTTVATVKDFAIVRATAGLNTDDSQFLNNVNPTTGAAAKGLYVGFYHYAYYDLDDTHTANAEADHFFDQVKNYLIADGKHLMPVLDVEQPLREGWTGTELSQWITDWCNRVSSRALSEKGLLIKPIVYAGAYNAGGQMNDTICEYFPDWIPAWPSTLPDPQTANPSNIGLYQDWSFWQYAGGATGTCPGVGNGTTTPCDLDVFQGDDEGIKDYVIGSVGRWADGTRVQVNATSLKAWAEQTCNSATPWNDTWTNVSSGVNGTILEGPVYANGYMRWHIQYDNGVNGWSAEAFLNLITPGAVSNPNPANNANLSSLPTNFTWTAAANATSYDVYLDGVFKANVASNSWAHTTIGSGAHNWRVDARNDDVITTGTTWNFSYSNAPGLPANPFPANGALITATPVTLDWNDCANATSYQIWSGATLVSTVTSSQFGPINPLDGVRPWAIVAIGPGGSTTGPAWSFTVDKTAPTATYGNQTPTSGAVTFDFTISYADAVTGVDVSTFDSSDVTVTGPNSFSANATYISRVGNVATYRINAPGGTWNPADAGLYTVSQNTAQVKDLAGWYRPAGAIGTFTASPAYAYVSGSTLHIEYAVGNSVSIGVSGASTTTSENGQELSFASNAFSDIVIHGTSGDDSVTLLATIAKPISFDGQTGLDTLTLAAGAGHTFASDAGAASSDLRIVVDPGASAIFDATQHLRDLTVAGVAALTAGGPKVLALRGLAVTGLLDLNDNDALVNYDGASPLGTWDGSAYTGIAGLLVSGSNVGAWNGSPGIVSTNAGASGGLTIVAAAEASEVLGLNGGDTDTWNGQPIDATTVLIKYTYNGDADLNGELNGDDYFRIDSNVLQSGALFGFVVGEFDLNGEINGDDYFLIDSYILQAVVPL